MSAPHLRCLREEIFSWNAYSAPTAEFAVKLDAMESPYQMDAQITEEWGKKLAGCAINRYPQSKPTALHRRLAQHIGVPDHCRLTFGNGSDELIQLLMLALSKPGNCVLSPQPSFSVYPMVANITGLNYISVALDKDNFSLDESAMLAAITEHRPALVCLAQPNNPTGNLWSADSVEAIIRHTPGYVLIDEAYAPFATRDYMELLNQYDNVLILRTFSKIGFAGLRFGFLISHYLLTRQLEKLRLPYNTGSLVHCGIEFALDHYLYFKKKVDEILVLRKSLFNQLSSLPGLQVFASETNFILFRTSAGRAGDIFATLKQRGILIKNLTAEAGLQDCLRVTVGTADENRIFIQSLEDILSNG